MKHLDEIERVFLDVLDLPLAERPARLDALCAGDSDLRARVESLLMAQENSGDFLGRTLPECLAADFTDDLTKEGVIALQVHGIGKKEEAVGKEVMWRNIRLQELK